MFAAMVRKELRENLRWGLVGLVLSTAAVTLALFKSTINTDIHASAGIATDVFQVMTVLVCPIVGSLLGLAASLRESRRDRWSFLVHRPASRTRIFLAKSAAALLLYAIAAGLPIALACLYHAIPGHFPFPFVPALLLPPLADFATGVVYLFLAMTVALRHAGWMRSRILPVGIGLVCSVAAVGMESFTGAAIAIAVCVPLAAATAWGQFLTGGNWQYQPRLAKSALYLSVATGTFLLGALAVTIASELLTPRQDYRSYIMGPSGKVYLSVQRDGQPAAVEPVPGGPDLDRTAAAAELGTLRQNGRSLYPAHLVLGTTPEWYARGASAEYRDRARHARYFGTAHGVAWYYLIRDRVVVGYQLETGRHTASAGPEGFIKSPTTRPFHAPAIDTSFSFAGGILAFPDAVYALTFRDPTVDKVYEPPPGVTVLDAVRFNGGDDQLTTVVATSDRQLHFQSGRRRLASIPVTRDPAAYDLARVATTTTGRLIVWYEPGYWHGDEGRKRPTYVEIYARDGRKISEQEIPALPLEHGSLAQETAPAFGVPVIVGLVATGIVIPFGGTFLDYETIIAASLVLAGALLASLLTWFITSRHALPSPTRLAWTLTNFLFGLAGLLTMLAVRDWPARVPCPHCRKPRPVDTDTCPHCTDPWPPQAEADGTEVFEPATPATAETVVT